MSTTSPGYAADIKPLFRELDRTSMLKVFDLWDRAGNPVVTTELARLAR